jgi:hypothetical protein
MRTAVTCWIGNRTGICITSIGRRESTSLPPLVAILIASPSLLMRLLAGGRQGSRQVASTSSSKRSSQATHTLSAEVSSRASSSARKQAWRHPHSCCLRPDSSRQTTVASSSGGFVRSSDSQVVQSASICESGPSANVASSCWVPRHFCGEVTFEIYPCEVSVGWSVGAAGSHHRQ